MLGGIDPEPAGLDLRGAFVGSEGTMGIATRIAVRLTPLPPAVATLLADFATMDEAAAAVTGVIAAGIVPAALEMMDATIVEVVEAYVHAGFPTRLRRRVAGRGRRVAGWGGGPDVGGVRGAAGARGPVGPGGIR